MKKAERFVIILTGSSGSGKSTLAKQASGLGFSVIDADKAAHRLYRKGQPLWKALCRAFGPEILGPGREIDRKRLGARVFFSRSAMARLKQLAYPALVRDLRRQIKSKRRVLLDMAVYFDAGAPDFGGKVVLVQAPLKLRVGRLMAKGLDRKRALAQARALRFPKSTQKRADLLLTNASSPSAMKARFMEWINHNP